MRYNTQNATFGLHLKGPCWQFQNDWIPRSSFKVITSASMKNDLISFNFSSLIDHKKAQLFFTAFVHREQLLSLRCVIFMKFSIISLISFFLRLFFRSRNFRHFSLHASSFSSSWFLCQKCPRLIYCANFKHISVLSLWQRGRRRR